MVTLRPVGDVELWYAEGEARAWRLPLHVEWKINQETGAVYGLVLPGVAFYELQLLAIRSLFSGYALDERDDRWLVPRDVLPTKLSKAPGINAKFYYHWPSGVHPPIPAPYHSMVMPTARPAPTPPKVEVDRDLSDYIAKERGIPSDIVTTVLSAFGQLAPRWMLERREPLDLGFCKLAALPFRTNWKEIVCYKMRVHPFFKVLRQAQAVRLRLLDSIGFPQAVTSGHNVAMRVHDYDKSRCTLQYILEAVPTTHFEKTCQELEKERQKPGTTSYVGHFEWSIQKLYGFIIETMVHHMRKATAPWGTVRVSKHTGIVAFHPRRGRAYIDGYRADLENLPVHICPPDTRFSVFGEDPQASDPQLLHPETGALPVLPAVPPSPDDVRQRAVGGDLGESRSDGALGLSVLDASQGTGPGRGLLPGNSTPR